MTRPMADLSLKLILRTVDKATAPLRKIERAVREVGRQTGLDQVVRAAARTGRQLGRVGREAQRFARRTGLAAIAAGTAAFGLTGRFSIAGDDVAKLADRLGFGVVELQRWRYAAKLSGIEAQTFDMATQRFGRRAAEAAAGTGEAKGALRFLGIQLRDTTGKMRPTGELLYDVAEALQKIESPLVRNRIAFKLFDSEGVDVGRMLAQGREKLREYGDEAERLGVITEDQARAAERYRDEMAATRRAVSFLGHTIGADLLPFMTGLIRDARRLAVEWRPDAVKAMRGVIRDLGGAVRWLRSGWAWLQASGKRWINWLQMTFPPIRGWIAMARQWLEEMGLLRLAAIAVAAALGARLLRAVLGLFGPLARLGFAIVASGVKMLWLAGVGVVKAAAGLVWLARNFGLAAFAAKYFIVTATAAAFARVANGLRAAGRAARGFNRILMRNPVILIGMLIAGAALLIYRYWDDIAAWFGRQWAAIKAAVPVGAWIEEIKGFSLWAAMTGWWGGIVAEFEKYWAEIEDAFDFANLRKLWNDFDRWLKKTVDGMTGWMPDWLKRQLGIKVSSRSGDAPRRPGDAPGGSAGAVSIFDRRGPGAAPARVGGRIGVTVDVRDDRTRVRTTRLESDNPGVPFDVTAGIATAAP